MYSAKVIYQSVARLSDALKLKLTYHDASTIASRREDLDKALDLDTGQFKRELTTDELSFIKNERLLCAVDFHYWSDNYAALIKDQGGLGTVQSWESQRLILAYIARLEDEMVDKALRSEPVDGILLALHKARQLGATTLGRKVSMHRLTTSKHCRVFAGSVDDDKVLELYDRDKTIIDNLPFYLRPLIGFDEKAQHIFCERLGSRVIYQTSAQQSGVGQGRTFDVSHLTECASWEYPDRIEHDFLPTIPQSKAAFTLWESTAQGRGNWWHQLVMRLQKRQVSRVKLVFIPWYAERTKYRRQPPQDWKPSEESMAHAQRVHETSERYVGRQVMLPADQLYWWESTRQEYYESNNLNLFYTNYCATIEESFQHSTKSAFSFETLEYYRQRVFDGISYRVGTEVLA